MFNPILRLVVAVRLGVGRASARLAESDRGQSTAEYALVLGGVAALVLAAFTDSSLFTSIIKKAVDAVTALIK